MQTSAARGSCDPRRRADPAINGRGLLGCVHRASTLRVLGEFDTKTSSWVKTPTRIRKLGGAIFCDRRYDTVFTYHNGAESCYAAREFRGVVRV